jgi:branched-chain amino acid transport system permease protein
MPHDAKAPELRVAAPQRGRDILAWKLSPYEAIPWLAAVALFAFASDYLALGTSMLVMILLALSLDLLTGYAGIVTLGHALYFGFGAYAAGLIAKYGWNEPFSGLIIATLLTGVVGGLLGVVLSQLRGMPMIMTSMALGLIAYEGAKSASWLTGGDDGLQGFAMAPIFGMFRWSVYGHTAYLYALAWLFVFFVGIRRLVASPFGLALKGLRENYGRMQLIGAPVRRHVIWLFGLSSALAGAAGALSAQTTSFVDVNVFSVDVSASVLVMLVIGGLGRLYGAFAGVAFYMIVHNVASEIAPFYWMFVIGFLLVAVVLFSREGLMGLATAAARKMGRTSK